MSTKISFSLAAAAVCLLTAPPADAQSNVNALLVKPNVIRSDPGNNLVIDASGFPNLATIHEDPFSNNGNPTQFNRHDLLFSADGGVTARKFRNQEAFDVSVDVTLDAGFDSPRKEAGLRINFFGFDGQFIVTTNDGEIAAFGATLPFYDFTDPVGTDPPGGGQRPYESGETMNLRMVYTPAVFVEGSMPPVVAPGKEGTIQYIIDRGDGPVSSPLFKFSGTESGIIDNSEIGVYLQATGVAPPPLPTPADFADVSFANFKIAIGDADFDSDGDVDGQDFLIWQRGLGTADAALAQGDANGDDAVNALDLDVFRAQFGAGPSAASPVAGSTPEPASLWLIVGAAAALAPFARRKTSVHGASNRGRARRLCESA